MKVVLFGATGMVGSGVLRECLLDPTVEGVLSIGRSGTGQSHPKLRELIHKDLADYSTIAPQLAGYDACFFCLGITSAGLSEEAYSRITYDYTLAAAGALLQQSPALVFIFVSGAGADSSGSSRTMWARVKGKAENAVLKLPFKAAYVFRPAYIQPVHGVVSRTSAYRWLYVLMAPLYPLWKVLLPKYVTTTEHLGRAMLVLATRGGPKRVLESVDIEQLGSQALTAER